LRRLSVQESLTPFIDHGYDVISKIRVYLTIARSTTLEPVKTANLWLCDTALHWLSLQYSIFKIAESGTHDERWAALNSFVANYASELKLQAIPLPLLGNAYFSTGSFQYYRRLALRLEREYYVVSVDASDPPVFWPLLLHEVSHCWLGSRNYVDVICGTHSDDVGRMEREVVERRVEEALCDALATRIIGPAYPFSYFNKLWAQFPTKAAQEYPSHRFRVECMARVLDDLQFYQMAEETRSLGNERFADNWQDEDISWSINDLISVTRELPELVSPELYSMVEESSRTLESSPPKDLPTLFLSCWMWVDTAELNRIPSTLDKTSTIILRTLKGWPSSSNT
jgi:hypothetical protein